MKTYPIPMVPGPVRVPEDVLAVYRTNYGAADLESDFFQLYNTCETRLQQILETKNTVVIQTGEGMLALWSALKSCLVPGDRVLSIATGVFGYGIGDMARSIGADVRTIGLDYDRTISDLTDIEKAVDEFQPRMITVVHCETPSGTLNPLEALGRLKQAHQVPLLYVDAVASAGGTPVRVDDRHIDLCLGGAQKCLSAPPSMAFLSVSRAAWNRIVEVGYVGYDALKPFENAQSERYFPYTPYWHGVAALSAGAKILLSEGLSNSYSRHEKVAAYCRQNIERLGFSLFPAADAVPSPTVTAVNMPSGISWQKFDERCRKRGLVMGGSYGPMSGKVFRLGHMGTQANMDLVEQAIDVLAKSL